VIPKRFKEESMNTEFYYADENYGFRFRSGVEDTYFTWDIDPGGIFARGWFCMPCTAAE